MVYTITHHLVLFAEKGGCIKCDFETCYLVSAPVDLSAIGQVHANTQCVGGAINRNTMSGLSR